MSSGAAEFQRGFRGDRLDVSDAAHAVGSKNFFILHRPANETPEGLLVNGNYAEDATERVPPVGLLVDGRAKSGLMNSVRASFQRVKKALRWNVLPIVIAQEDAFRSEEHTSELQSP